MKLATGVLAFLALTLGLAGQTPDIEAQVRNATKSDEVTIVHLWAPWCPNCKAELANDRWSGFIHANPDVTVIFVTVWAGEQGDGRALLERYGVGNQPNFKLLMHPNTSRSKGEKLTMFLGQPVSWIPTTWVFRAGTLRYALNYGELHFPMLQQLVRDAQDKWEH